MINVKKTIATILLAFFFLTSSIRAAQDDSDYYALRTIQWFSEEVPIGAQIFNRIAVVDTGCSPEVDPTGSLGNNLVAGWNAVDQGPDYSDVDPAHHGTYISGLVASYLGVATTAPLLVIRAGVLTDHGVAINNAAAARGIHWAVDNGATVINCSWNGEFFTELQEAVDYAEVHGVLIIASAGNDSTDLDINPDGWSSLQNANVIRVAASKANGELVSSSSWGHGRVELAAQVERVLHVGSTSTNFINATASSAASGITTGVAGLLRNTLSMQEVKDRIVRSARQTDALTNKVWSGGTLAPGRAIAGEANQSVDSIMFKGKFKNQKKLVINGTETLFDVQASNPILRVWVQNSLVGVVSPQQNGTFSFITKGRFATGTEVLVQSSLGGEMKWNIP